MKKIAFNLIVIISSAVALIILMFFTSGIKELYRLLINAKYYWIGVAFICMAMYWLFDGIILHIISTSLSEKQPLKNTLRVTMIGQFFNCLTPFGTGGQPVQVYVLAKDGVKPGHAASIIVMKSLLHQIIIVFYTLIAVIFRGSLFGAKVPHFYILFFAGFIINVAFLLFYGLFFYKKEPAIKILMFIINILKSLHFIKNLDTVKEKIEAEVSSFSEGAIAMMNNISVVFKMIILQVIQYTFFFAIPYFIYLAVEAAGKINFWDVVAAQSIITMIQLLIPSPGSIGGAEGASYLFFSIFFNAGLIIPVILIWRIITYYSSIILGGLFSVVAPEKPLKT